MENLNPVLIQFKKEFEEAINKAEELKQKYSDEQLDKNPTPGKWSAGECLEHLNITAKGYIQNTKKVLAEVQKTKYDLTSYKPRFLAGKFISIIGEESKTKMKTPKSFTALYGGNKNKTIEYFINCQKEFISLVEESANYDISKVKVPSPVTALLKFRLGEVFLMNINHQKRHLKQAKEAAEKTAIE